MGEPKRPRGRPKTGRIQYKKLTLDLKPEEFEFLNYLAEKHKKTRRKIIFEALEHFENMTKK